MAESCNIMDFKNMDYMDPSNESKENTHSDDQDHQLIMKDLEETVETTPDDRDTLPGALFIEDDAIEIRTLLTDTICVKEEVKYPIEDVTAESLATTSDPLPATRAQDSEQSSDEELGAEFLREAARNLHLAMRISKRHKISRMQDEINSLKGVVDLMRTEIKHLQSLVQRHENDLNKFHPDRTTMEDAEEETGDTEYDPQPHPNAVERASVSLQRNIHFRQSTPPPKRPRTETKSPQAGPSRQPVTPQPRPSQQDRSVAMDLDFPIKCATTLELLNKKLASCGNFKDEFMKMLTDCYCVNLYDIVEFPLLTEYNLTGKGITNGKKLCTLKVFECFADFWAAKKGISVTDATTELGDKLAHDKRIRAKNKCKAKNNKGK